MRRPQTLFMGPVRKPDATVDVWVFNVVKSDGSQMTMSYSTGPTAYRARVNLAMAGNAYKVSSDTLLTAIQTAILQAMNNKPEAMGK